MKAFALLAAVGATAGLAQASTISVPDFFMPVHLTSGADDPLLLNDVAGLPAFTYTGFIITFDYTEDPADSSWASDMEISIILSGGAGDSFLINGTFGGSGGDEFPVADYTEVFVPSYNGSASNLDGTYSTAHTFAAPASHAGGAVFVDFTDVWQGGYGISNFTIEFIKIPAPGAVALMGLGGLAAIRRRR